LSDDSKPIFKLRPPSSSNGEITARSVYSEVSVHTTRLRLDPDASIVAFQFGEIRWSGVDFVGWSPNGGGLGIPGWISLTAGASGGEANTASNVGGQKEVFKAKLGTDLQFKTLEGGTGVTIDDTDPDKLVINSSVIGISGYSGTSGISGFSGYSGLSGLNGISGTSGKSGKSGFSGTGLSGFSGMSGLSDRTEHLKWMSESALIKLIRLPVMPIMASVGNRQECLLSFLDLNFGNPAPFLKKLL